MAYENMDSGMYKCTWVQYEGGFLNDKRHGKGTIIFCNAEKFVGNWINGVVNGEGKIYKTDGRVFTEQWVDNLLVKSDPAGFGNRQPSFDLSNPKIVK